VLSNPKEQKLRASGGWWSQEVRLQANPHNKRPFYRETLSVTLLQELMSRYAKNGWLASPRVVHGRSVFLESMFMSTAGTGPTDNMRLAVHMRDGIHPHASPVSRHGGQAGCLSAYEPRERACRLVHTGANTPRRRFVRVPPMSGRR
jgi:hypothetical protein